MLYPKSGGGLLCSCWALQEEMPMVERATEQMGRGVAGQCGAEFGLYIEIYLDRLEYTLDSARPSSINSIITHPQLNAPLSKVGV